ncbi:MAG TPA: class II fructose-bisphosphatase [Euzebya sp.]|nr:class II fructose-bisphosphatase [Euzebya sp.]
MSKPDRNLAMELVRATEAAAIAAGRWMGRNLKEAGDQAAVDAMRSMLDTVDMDGVVVIGEGEKDEAPMLFNGEHVGSGRGPQTDIAVDPIDGTRLLAEGRPGSLAVLAMSPRGTMFNPGPMVYMNKWVVGADAVGVVDIDAPIAENLARIAKAKDKGVSDLTVIMLDRQRHAEMAQGVRDAGARLRLIMDGDIAGGLLAALPDRSIDVSIGIGGTPEGVTTACALRAIGGEMLGRLWARDDAEAAVAREQGYDLQEVLTTERMVASPDTFFVCTGVTAGDLVDGVVYTGSGVLTESLSMRGKSGTLRFIKAQHTTRKLHQLGAAGA